MPLVLPLVIAMVVTTACLPLFGRFAARWGIVDQPGVRKVHLNTIPRVGGVAMALGVMLAAILAVPLEQPDKYFLLAAGILTVFGVLDDRFDLNYRVKLLGQAIAATVVIFAGDVQIHAITLDDGVMLPTWLSVPLTFVFLVGITNAINLADGLDGLAGGTTFLSLCALAILAYSVGQLSCTALALAFAGAVLGFLRYNTFPAVVFMGDAGSQLLGFTVGVLSLRATQSGNGDVVSAATPILLLALPILDTLSVMVQRIGEGRSPFSADKNHIHHKLLAMGFNHHEAVMVIYIVQADLFLLAYWTRFESDLTILGIVSVFFLLSIALLQVAGRRRWRIRAPKLTDGDSPLVLLITRLRKPGLLPRWSYVAIALAACAYATTVTVETVRLSADIRYLLMALLAISVVWFAVLRGKPLSAVEKGGLYVIAAVLVYLDSAVLNDSEVATTLTWLAIGTMAVGTVIRIRTAKDRRFQITSLDLIVLFVALVVPSLPGSLGLPDGGALGIAKLIVMFYAIEVLVTRTELPVAFLRFAAAMLLTGLIVRPFL